MAKLPREGLSSWPADNCSMTPKGAKGTVWETMV